MGWGRGNRRWVGVCVGIGVRVGMGARWGRSNGRWVSVSAGVRVGGWGEDGGGGGSEGGERDIESTVLREEQGTYLGRRFSINTTE